jgi:hypothetical protein
MRTLVLGIGLLTCAPILAIADDPTPTPDYRELSKVIQQQVVKKLPKEVEKRFGWGETIPLPPRLPLPRLRTYVKVGDHIEVPHGPWRRVKGRIEDPSKDLDIQVREFRQLEPTTYRLALDADTTVNCEAEWQQWQKGLRLVGATAVADAALRISLVCDVGVSLDLSTFPPAVNLEPKVKELHIDLKSLNLRHLGNRIVQAENPKELGERFEDVLRDALHQSEPILKDYANDAIARGLREGKGGVAPAALLKAAQNAAKK